MATSDTSRAKTALAALGNVVPQGYEYREKLFTPTEDLRLPSAWLKWYHLSFPEAPITPDQASECRAFVASEVTSGRLSLDGELGFVILHRAGPVLLLMVCTWRNTNELWESVYVRHVEGFGGYVPATYETAHRGTFCVWELGAVWHERDAWTRFIASARDDAAKMAYLDDKLSGLI